MKRSWLLVSLLALAVALPVLLIASLKIRHHAKATSSASASIETPADEIQIQPVPAAAAPSAANKADLLQKLSQVSAAPRIEDEIRELQFKIRNENTIDRLNSDSLSMDERKSLMGQIHRLADLKMALIARKIAKIENEMKGLKK